MRFESTRRFLAHLAVPAVFALTSGASGTSPANDEHAAVAAPAGHDEHGHGSLAKAEQTPTTEKTTTTAAPSRGEPKAETKTDAKPGSMRMAEQRPEPRTSTKAKPSTEATDTPITADAALKLLQEGNQRWVMDKDENPNTEPFRRAMLTEKGQKPFVTVLTCADSRLPVERIFDRGVGEVFVVRVAGNVAGTSETGTIEYGVEHLKTPLLVVMGHTKCGAVAAAASGAELHGALGELVANITPAVDRVKRNNPDIDEKQIAPLAVKENVWQSITDLLKHSPELRAAVSSKEIKVVGAVCDIATGKVEWMGEHPWQAELVEAFNSRSSRTTTANADKNEEK
jgi:carbonic anhydrase